MSLLRLVLLKTLLHAKIFETNHYGMEAFMEEVGVGLIINFKIDGDGTLGLSTNPNRVKNNKSISKPFIISIIKFKIGQ